MDITIGVLSDPPQRERVQIGMYVSHVLTDDLDTFTKPSVQWSF